MAHGSKKAVVTAIFANAIVTVLKFISGILSGSASMMNEAVHSLMDTLNQGFLFLGLREGERPPDEKYAFGHGQKKYLWNLWSAIGLFSIGAGLGLAHAWHAWHSVVHPDPFKLITIGSFAISALWLNLLVLGVGFILEGYSFLVAMREFLQRMRASGSSKPFAYLLASDDPTLVAIVLEDSVAMLGLLLAAIGVTAAAVTGNHIWDVLFSALIAATLGLVAFYLGYVNMRFLADMRDEKAEKIFKEVAEDHPEVERYHDLRSIILDESHTILVAEIELREEAIIPALAKAIELQEKKILETIPKEKLELEEVRRYAATRASVQATLARTETIIDEIEKAVRVRHPRVSHITIEVEGIS